MKRLKHLLPEPFRDPTSGGMAPASMGILAAEMSAKHSARRKRARRSRTTTVANDAETEGDLIENFLRDESEYLLAQRERDLERTILPDWDGRE